MKRIFLAFMAVACASVAMAQTQVIAHRGYHATEGSCRNSIASLKAAQELGVFGSECDVNLTKDGVIVVAHGPYHPKKGEGVTIQKSTFEEVSAIKLENGETIPTLDDYLAQMKKNPACKLIIEIKDHATPKKETKVVEMTLAKVKEYGLEDKVEYIAFRPFVCMEIMRLNPEAKCAFLTSDVKTTYNPTYIKGMGLTGLDYKYEVIKKHPKWIADAHKKGLTVNVWTVQEEEKINWLIENGVDYITTDDPVLCKKLIAEANK